MKANAPEKLYVELFKGEWNVSKSPVVTSVEYIRTDAFIEKACDAYCAICDTKECEGCAECTWVIKFRRQLEKL